MLIGIDRPEFAPVWGACAGMGIGGIIPVAVVLGRGAPGAHSRLRAGMLVGGAFGTGVLITTGVGYIVGMFPEDSPEPTAWALRSVIALMLAEAILAWMLIGKEKLAPEEVS